MKKMKKTFSILLSIILLNTFAQETKKALFLGNSYTYYNGGLPNMLENIANANGDFLIHDQNTPGGYTLESHSTNVTGLNKIKANDWDFVVLQGQSQRPSFPPAQVATQVKPYAAILNDSIKANNPCTKTMFFMTWGKKNGDQGNCAGYPILCTFEGVSQRLRESYLEMTIENNADCAPVGMAWKKARTDFPNIELFHTDGSHPSIAGTYLSACVFYSSMYYKTTVGNTYWSSLDSLTAYRLQVIASATVLDSLSVWSIETIPTSFDENDSTIITCDSVEINGTWFSNSTTFSDTILSVGSCASITNYDIQIGSQTIDTTIISCGILQLNGDIFSSDTIFSDTSIVGGCNVIYNYDILIELDGPVEILDFNTIYLLKSNSGVIFLRINVDNYDSLFLYMNGVLIDSFLDTTGFIVSSYPCNENDYNTYNMMLIAKNNCSSDTAYTETYCQSSSINELDNTNWKIYPNPANYFIQINSEKQIEYSVNFMDITGKELIVKQKTKNKNVQLDISSFEKGIYFIVLYDKNGNPIGQKRVIVN